MIIEDAAPNTTSSQEKKLKRREKGTGDRNRPEAKETKGTEEDTKSSCC